MFTKRLLMSSNTPINLKIIRFRSIYRRGKFYFAHLVVSWLNHGFGQEQLFHPLYAHIHAKVSIQSWYCIQYLFLFLFFLEARVVGAKNPHSAYEALFETVRVIFPWLSYDSARIQLYILGIRPPRARLTSCKSARAALAGSDPCTHMVTPYSEYSSVHQ